MRIFYITRARLSFLRAHTQNIVKTAEYMSNQKDISVEVFSAASEPKTTQKIFADKNVSQPFLLDVSSKRRSLVYALWARRRAFDVLYFRDPFLWPQALFARLALGKKIIFEVHGSYEWRFAYPIWRFAVFISNGAVFITRALADFYHTKKPFVVVHTNGVELKDYENLPDTKSLRGELGLPLDKTIVLYVGSFIWYSADFLDEVLTYLPESVALVAVGIKEGEIHSVSKRFIAIGRVLPRNIPRYLAAADILVNPLAVSYPSSISSKLYEYLAAGRPVVSSKGGANGEILRDGENALVLDTLDAESFARAIMRLTSNPQLREKLSKRARADAAEYTWEKRVEKIKKIIDAVNL